MQHYIYLFEWCLQAAFGSARVDWSQQFVFQGMASVGRLSRALRARRGYATLLLAEHNNKSLNKATLHAVTAASKLPGCTSVDLLVAGKGCGEVAKAGASTQGVSKVLVAESDQLEHPVADVVAELLEAVQKQNSFKVIAGISSSLVKECLPRVAANLDVQPVTDILEVGQEDGVFSRPMYAGNAIATVKTSDSVRLLTFRQTAFEAAPESASAAPIESLSAATYSGAGIEWLKDSEATSDKPQLSSASRVVAGGRGLKNGENFEKVLEPLCDKLKAALGASRAAVDAGFVPNELQVGQTGKVVAPQLYIAVGISGAIQHLAGMKDSKTIVAINKDADAPIFQVADYGLVADLFETVPELTDKVWVELKAFSSVALASLLPPQSVTVSSGQPERSSPWRHNLHTFREARSQVGSLAPNDLRLPWIFKNHLESSWE